MMPTAKANRIDWDAPEMTALIRAAIGEDVGSGDLTTSALVPADRFARARIVAKQNLVVVGLPVAERVFRALDSDILFQSEEHTSELQSQFHLVCRLLLEKK